MGQFIPDVSYPTVFHWTAWFLLALVIWYIGASIAGVILGDRTKSPLDRWATWTASVITDDDGKPLVKPGTTPSTLQKIASALYFLAVISLMVWFIRLFSSV